MYKRIGLALAFSPRCQAMLAEAYRLKQLFDAELICIHIGPKGKPEEDYMDKVLEKANIGKDEVKLFWEEGRPIKKILSICKRENIDLLVAGALRKENLLKYYIGSIARRIIRKSSCSVLMLINPSERPHSFKKIIINGSDGAKDLKTIQKGIKMAHLEDASYTCIFKDVHGYALSLMMATEETESEFSERRRDFVQQEVDEMKDLLTSIDTFNVNINIKIAGGKEGYELWKFVTKTNADLLVVKAPERKLAFLDRIFPHYLEMIMSDLPSNLLLDHTKSTWKI